MSVDNHNIDFDMGMHKGQSDYCLLYKQNSHVLCSLQHLMYKVQHFSRPERQLYFWFADHRGS